MQSRPGSCLALATSLTARGLCASRPAFWAVPSTPSHQFTCGWEAVAESPRLRHLSCAPAAPAREGRAQLCVPSVPSSSSGLALGPACVCTSTQASTYVQAGQARVCTYACATLVPADVGELQ